VADIVLRLATLEERDALEALQLRASLANEGDRQAILDNPDAIDVPMAQIEAGLVIVAEAEDRVIGFAAILPREDADIDLDGLFVDPDLWRGGVGSALVRQCCDMARLRRANHLYVLGNPHALGFYEGCGFQPLGVEATRFGAGVILRKAL
jgi:GNAT superfamily N-acetyltransferase